MNTKSDFFSDLRNRSLSAICQRHSNLNDRFDKTEWVIADLIGLVVRLTWNRHTEYIVRVESDGDVTAYRAVDAWFKLSVEKLHENRVITLHKPCPKFSCNLLVRPIITVFHLNIRLSRYFINIFVHGLEKYWEHLLRIMLGKSLKLNSLSSDPVFDIPRSNVFLTPCPQVWQELCKSFSESASCSKCISLIYVAHIYFKEEIFYERLCVCKTL